MVYVDVVLSGNPQSPTAALNEFLDAPFIVRRYGLEVDVRNSGGTAAYETVSNLTFTMT